MLSRLVDDAATLVGLGYTCAVAGQRERGQAIQQQLAELATHRYVSPDDHAIVCLGLGDVKQTFSWLRTVVADRSEWLCKFGVDPVLDALRSESRFKELLRLVNGASLAPDLFAEKLRAEGTEAQDMRHGVGVPTFGEHGH